MNSIFPVIFIHIFHFGCWLLPEKFSDGGRWPEKIALPNLATICLDCSPAPALAHTLLLKIKRTIAAGQSKH